MNYSVYIHCSHNVMLKARHEKETRTKAKHNPSNLWDTKEEDPLLYGPSIEGS